MESVQQCAMLDGDSLVAANPAPDDELDHLDATIALLVAHDRRLGYRHFVVDHIWTTPEHIDDLRRRIADHDTEFRCFLRSLRRNARCCLGVSPVTWVGLITCRRHRRSSSRPC